MSTRERPHRHQTRPVGPVTADARAIADELIAGDVKLSLGGAVHDHADPVGRLPFNGLGMVAELVTDLIRVRTREGVAVARAKGRLNGKKPTLSPA